jgi:hypothetical protein
MKRVSTRPREDGRSDVRRSERGSEGILTTQVVLSRIRDSLGGHDSSGWTRFRLR